MTLARTIMVVACAVLVGLATVSQRLALYRVGSETARLEALGATMLRERAAMRSRYEAVTTPRAAAERLNGAAEEFRVPSSEFGVTQLGTPNTEL